MRSTKKKSIMIKPLAGSLYLCICLSLATWIFSGYKQDSTAVSRLPYYLSEDLTPEWLDKKSLAEQNDHVIGEFGLYNQSGAVLTSDDLAGKIYVANFFFVHCSGICPMLRTNMAKVQEAYLADDSVKLLSYSVMPDLDMGDKLSHYAKVNKVENNKWHLLTGEKSSIFNLAKTSYFTDLDSEMTDNQLHSESFFLVDAQRRIRGVYNGTLALDIQRLIEDIAVLRMEMMS